MDGDPDSRLDPARDHVKHALQQADDPDARYHLRQALQLLEP
jgi:hypothetical protein